MKKKKKTDHVCTADELDYMISLSTGKVKLTKKTKIYEKTN